MSKFYLLRKIFLFLLLQFVCESPVFAYTHIALDDLTVFESDTPIYPNRIVEYNGDSVKVMYSIDFVTLDSAYINKENQYILSIPDFGIIKQGGLPHLPQRLEDFMVKSNNVNIIYNVTDSISFPINLMLETTRMLDGTEVSGEAVSMSCNFAPISITEIQGTRDGNICYLSFKPVKYDRDTRNVTIARKIEYTLHGIINPENASNARVESNGNQLECPYIDNTDDEYLIITADKFLEPVKSFAEWKRMLGFRTHVVSRDSWKYDIHVMDSIQSYYARYPNIKYLLIVGNSEYVTGTKFVPSQTLVNIGYPRNCLADYLYGCVSNNFKVSNSPDFYTGRIIVTDTYEAKVVLDKIRAYEEGANLYNKSMFSVGIHIGQFDMGWDDRTDQQDSIFRGFITTSEDIIKAIQKSSNVTCRRIYYSENKNPYPYENLGYDWSGNAEKINDAWCEGAYYAFYSGHGQVSCWECPQYNIYDLDDQWIESVSEEYPTNHVYPVVFGLTCWSGKYDEECLASRFLIKENGGAAGIFACTERSDTPNTMFTDVCLFDSFISSPIKTEQFGGFNRGEDYKPSYRMGQMLDASHKRLFKGFGINDATKYHAAVTHYFGDPSMMIRTQNPEKIDYTFKYDKDTNICRVSVNGEPALISFYDANSDELQRTYGTYAEFQFTGISDSYFTNPYKLQCFTISAPNKKTVVWDDFRMVKEVVDPNIILFGDKIMVEYKCAPTDNVVIRMTNAMSGVVVKEVIGNPSSSLVSMNISNVPSGIYVINVIINGSITGFKTVNI